MRQHNILRQYGSFNVYQLMRVLLAGQPSTWPIEKRLRFRADLSLAFPGREFSSITVHRPKSAIGQAASVKPITGEVIEIHTANYSMASVLGPLPEPFTEWVRDLKRASEPAMADFLNIFNQRLNILRYQLKQAQTMGLNSVAPEETDQAKALGALAGLGLPQVQAQVPLPPRSWLSLAGLLANCRKSASTVVHVLNLLLNTKEKPEKIKVSLIPLIGAWQAIEPEDRFTLGRRNRQLGQRTVLGRRMWDQQARVRIVIDGIDYVDFCKLLPPNRALSSQPSGTDNADTADTDQSYYQRFLGILHLLLDRLADCEIEMNVTSATIPQQRQMRGMRLNQTAWLGSRQMPPTRRVTYLIPAHGSARAA
jgi:type VI secretion system protein ImpH